MQAAVLVFFTASARAWIISSDFFATVFREGNYIVLRSIKLARNHLGRSMSLQRPHAQRVMERNEKRCHSMLFIIGLLCSQCFYIFENILHFAAVLEDDCNLSML